VPFHCNDSNNWEYTIVRETSMPKNTWKSANISKKKSTWTLLKLVINLKMKINVFFSVKQQHKNLCCKLGYYMYLFYIRNIV